MNPKFNLWKYRPVKIVNNSVFKCMRLEEVTGDFMGWYPDMKSFAIQCKKTNAQETVDFNDEELFYREGEDFIKLTN